MKKILELILALGNYMNSSKKGACYGFRLQSLDSLTITKSSDKKHNFVHYLADLVNKKYPELKTFSAELKFIDKAAQYSLENILTGSFHIKNHTLEFLNILERSEVRSVLGSRPHCYR